MAQEKLLNLANLEYFKEKQDAVIDAKDAKVLEDAKSYFDGRVDEFDEAGAAATVQGKLDEEVARAKSAEEANKALAEGAQADVDALAEKVGEVTEGKTVVEMIADAQSNATYDDTEVKSGIQENKEAIALLNDGSTVEGSVDYKIAQAVAAIMENPDETMNSINELVTWINGHAEDALELSNKVTANEEAITDLEELVGTEGVAKQITDAIAEALTVDGVDKYALATDLTSAIARIATLESKAHEHENKEVLDSITSEKVSAWDASEQNAKEYADGLNTAMDGRVEAVEGAVATKVEQDVYNTKVAALEGEDTAIKGRLDALEEAVGEDGAVGEQIDAKIADLDSDITSAEVEEGKGIRVQVTETDGKVATVVVTGNYDNSYDAKGAAATAEQNAKDYADGKDNAIAEAKQVGVDAATAVTTLENGKVAENATAIAELQASQPELITTEEIDAMFATEE